MPRTKAEPANEPQPANEAQNVAVPVEIGETLSFADVLRIQRQLERDGLAVPPADPPPRKKLRAF